MTITVEIPEEFAGELIAKGQNPARPRSDCSGRVQERPPERS